MRSSLPPGPRFAALQSLRYLREPFGYYEEMRRRYGTLFTLPSLNGTLVVTGTPEGALELFQSPSEDFVVGFGVDALLPVVGPGSLLLLDSDRHRRERKLLSPAFHGSRMRAYSEMIRDAALRHAEEWKEGEVFPVQETMQKIALEVMMRAVFGVQNTEDADRFGEVVMTAVNEAHPAPLFFKSLQREFFGFGPWARFMRERKRVETILHAHIVSRRRDLAKGAAPGDDILSQLLTARFDDGTGMPDDAIFSQLLTLLVAGHETTASTLAWALYEIHRQPNVLARARADISSVGLDAPAEEIAALPSLQAIADETLRIHPIVAEAVRTVKEGVRFQGYDLPAGISIAVSIIMIHNDPELYPEPERFRPERFLERKHGPSEHLPFGGGYRRCIGAAFAMNEIKIVLGTLLPRFELALAEDRPLATVRRSVTLAPEAGVPMVLRGRLA